MSNLLKKLIKVAYHNPQMQPQLLPVIQNQVPMYYQLVPVQAPMVPQQMQVPPQVQGPASDVVNTQQVVDLDPKDFDSSDLIQPQKNKFYDIQRKKTEMVNHIEQSLKDVELLLKLCKEYQVENSYAAFLEMSEIYSFLKEEKLRLEKSLAKVEMVLNQMKDVKEKNLPAD